MVRTAHPYAQVVMALGQCSRYGFDNFSRFALGWAGILAVQTAYDFLRILGQYLVPIAVSPANKAIPAR